MTKTPRTHLTRRESQIMEVVHRRRRATVEEIRSELPRPPSPPSVGKLLEIMIDRGLLGREYDGPRYAYFPAMKPEDASRSALKDLLRTFFDNSPSSAMAARTSARWRCIQKPPTTVRATNDATVAMGAASAGSRSRT